MTGTLHKNSRTMGKSKSIIGRINGDYRRQGL